MPPTLLFWQLAPAPLTFLLLFFISLVFPAILSTAPGAFFPATISTLKIPPLRVAVAVSLLPVSLSSQSAKVFSSRLPLEFFSLFTAFHVRLLLLITPSSSSLPHLSSAFLPQLLNAFLPILWRS